MSLNPELPEFPNQPTGGGGGNQTPTTPINTPNQPPGTTTTNGVTSMNIKPSCENDGFLKTFKGNSLCFDISGQIVNPEEPEREPNSTLQYINMVKSSTGVYNKSGGVQNQYDAVMFEPALIDGRQNIYVQFVTSLTQPATGSKTGFCGFIGIDPLDRFLLQTLQVNNRYVAYIYIPNSLNYVAVYDPGASGLELSSSLRIWMTGTQVLFQHRRSGVWNTFYTAPIGGSSYGVQWGTANSNHPLLYPSIYKGGSTLPLDCSLVETTTPEGGEFSGAGCRRCWQSPNQNGDYPISFSYPRLDPVECVIRVEDLQIYSPNCEDEDIFAIIGTYLRVNHNGGSTAELIVSGGVAIDAYTWLLPVVPDRYSFKVRSNGIESELCFLNVVRELDVNGVIEGVYDNVAPGEVLTFEANCDDAVFESITHPELLEGNVFRAEGGDEDTFGSFESIIKVTGCGQVGYFTVVVMPIFPIPNFCGPKPKTIPIGHPDRDVMKSVSTGKNAQFLIQNKNPSISWEGLQYVGLRYIIPEETESPCKLNVSCVTPDKPTIAGCPVHLQSAKRLDDFVSFVNDEFGGFAYLDLRSFPPKLYKNVHFSKIAKPTSSHDWRTSQKRNYDLVFYPCCEGEENHSGSCIINNYSY